ncbi:MAG TPA: hypothetical protein VE547_04390, partial [Mycobacteriales bacterium]|nr:hypothetical protein [Mycobacteriales bacterium]
MTTPALSLALLALAVAVAVRPAAARARLRALDEEAGVSPRRQWPTARLRRSPGVPAAVGGLLLGGVAHFGFGEPVPVVPVLAGVLAGSAAGSLLAGAAEARERRREDAALVEWVGAMAADLRAGRQPAEVAAGHPAELRSPAVAA